MEDIICECKEVMVNNCSYFDEDGDLFIGFIEQKFIFECPKCKKRKLITLQWNNNIGLKKTREKEI